IAVYVLSEILATTLWVIRWQSGATFVSLHEAIHNTLFVPLGNPMNASLIFAVTYVLAMFLVAWILWKKQWFLKV
ncbi:MAG TPA: DUF5009 domain-containing protein, partial [Bacteroidota bacterium]